MKCQNCKYCGSEKINTYYDTQLQKVMDAPSGFFACHRIEHGNQDSETIKNDPTVLAVVIDGSGYSAQLLVRPDFGCCLFESK